MDCGNVHSKLTVVVLMLHGPVFIRTAVGVGGKAVALNEDVRVQKSRVHVNLFAGSRIKKRMG